MANLLSRLIDPWYPATAIGLEKGVASVVQLERVKGSVCKLRRAATFNIAESLVRPNFEETNIESPPQVAAVLSDLATSAGLMRQKRWSLSLPEATARTLVLTLESPAQSAGELQDVLRWKIERGFGVPVDELSISKERLQKDPQGRERYLVIAVKKSILAEYEAVLDSLVALSTEPIDVSGADASFNATVPITGLPEGLQILQPSSGEVEVLVQITQRGVRQSLPSQKVTIVGVDSGLEASVTPGEITIEVVGPEDALAELDSSTLQVVVDATGLGPGSYSVQPSVIMPPRVQWVTTFPAEVTLHITELPANATPEEESANGTPESAP